MFETKKNTLWYLANHCYFVSQFCLHCNQNIDYLYGNGLVSLNRWYIDVFKTTRILITHHLLTCNPTTKHINKWKVYEEILGDIALISNTRELWRCLLGTIFSPFILFTLQYLRASTFLEKKRNNNRRNQRSSHTKSENYNSN